MLKPKPTEIDAVFANPAGLFLAPEFAPFAAALADARAERDKSLAGTDCGSCRNSVNAKFDLWYAQQWYPKFVAALNASPSLSSVFVNILQVSEACPA